MTDTNPRAVMGANMPPEPIDPIDAITAEYDTSREESENWTDGTPVETEAQMKAVDALRESMRQWRIALEAGQKEAVAPLLAATNAERDRWKPTIADAKRIEGCLMAAVEPFKRKLAEQKAAEERAAWEATNKARREAEELARKANAADLEAQREVEAARQAALDAEQKARDAKANGVKGLRTETVAQIDDHKAALHWIARHDKDAMTAFVEEYVRRNFKAAEIDGVTRVTRKVSR